MSPVIVRRTCLTTDDRSVSCVRNGFSQHAIELRSLQVFENSRQNGLFSTTQLSYIRVNLAHGNFMLLWTSSVHLRLLCRHSNFSLRVEHKLISSAGSFRSITHPSNTLTPGVKLPGIGSAFMFYGRESLRVCFCFVGVARSIFQCFFS